MPVTLATMHPLAADPPSHRVGALAFFAVGLLAAISLTWHASVPINHDVAWVLQGARRLLDGGRFGRDIVDVNPPLIWWISLIPVQAARLLGADVGSTFTTFVVALCLASVASTHSVLRAGALPPRERAIAAVATAATLIIVPGYDFGQREHLLAVVAVPYVALASVRANGNAVPWWLAAGIGVFAAVGFCLKPHFLAIPALLELWLLANSRRLSGLARVEVGMLVVIGASYALAILAFAPLYLTRHVPEAIVTYGSYSQPIAAAALTYLLYALPFVIAGALIRQRQSLQLGCKFVPSLCVAAVGAMIAAILQSKGWSYHFLPCLSFLALAVAMTFAGLSREASRSVAALMAAAIVAGWTLNAAVSQVVERFAADGTPARVRLLAQAMMLHAGRDGPVYAFVTSPRDIHPALLLARARWIAEACCLYSLPAAIAAKGAPIDQGDKAQQRAAIAARQLDAAISAIARHRPRLIFIDDRPEKLAFAGRFDYLPFLLANDRFAALWPDYRELAPIGPFRIFGLRDRGPDTSS